MNNIIEWIKVNKDLIEGVEISYCLKSKDKSYDFRQLGFDLVIITMVSLTVKAIIALNIGQSYINLY